MMIIDKLKNFPSPSGSEEKIIKLILKQPESVINNTAQELAADTYTSASTVVRLCQKLGFDGYNNFRIKFAAEISQMTKKSGYIDANFPFKEGDDVQLIIDKISDLYRTTIESTVAMAEASDFQNAVEHLYNAKSISIFGSGSNLYLAQDFKYKMAKINHLVDFSLDTAYQLQNAFITKNSCAIIISYAGEKYEILKYAHLLKSSNSTIISITGLSNNSLAKISDIVLCIDHREHLHSKIGNFSSKTSIIMILDILYAGVFAKNYHENILKTVEIGKSVNTFNYNFESIQDE